MNVHNFHRIPQWLSFRQLSGMAARSVCRSNCCSSGHLLVHRRWRSEWNRGAAPNCLFKRAERYWHASPTPWLLPALSARRYSSLQGRSGNWPGMPQGKCVGLASAATGSLEKEQAGTVQQDELVDLLLEGVKTTSVAHAIWRRVVQAGDLVIDATCGNGWDTVQLAKLVFSETNPGSVIGVDVQETAVEKTYMLLDLELTLQQRNQVKLFTMCHTKIQELADDASVRLVAFNLGYLPGGDKQRITTRDTTVKALEAATRLVRSGGLISLMAYVGHPGGREEYEAVREFSQTLPTETWAVSHHEWLNRPTCPRLLFLYRK